MFEDIQKGLADMEAQLSKQSYQTAEVYAYVRPNQVYIGVRASLAKNVYPYTKTFTSIDEAQTYIWSLPNAVDHERAEIVAQMAKLQARAAEAGVELPS